MPAPTPRTVLVVDDEPNVRLVVKRMLEDQGFSVIVAENGHDAVLVLEHFRFDLLLTDLVMPGLDGEALAIMAQRLPQPPHIILMSSYHDAAPRPDLRWPVLVKPFNTKAL